MGDYILRDPDDEEISLIEARVTGGNSLFRLNRAFRLAGEFQRIQQKWFQEFVPRLDYISNEEGSIHGVVSEMPDLPEEWAFRVGEIFNQLVNARDNVFCDIVLHYSGMSNAKAVKQLGSMYWPSCRSLKEWENFETKHSFIPEFLRARILAYQPFRDRREDEGVPDARWMDLGAGVWSRIANNHDKHVGPVQLALNHYLGDPPARVVSSSERVKVYEMAQRFDFTDPTDREPLFCLRTDPDKAFSFSVETLSLLVKVRHSPKAEWSPLNRSIWHALEEIRMSLLTLYFGSHYAKSNRMPWSYDGIIDIADVRYKWHESRIGSIIGNQNYAEMAVEKGFI